VTDLTRRATDLLNTLVFRDSLGTTYVAQGGRGRLVVVVPTMMRNNPLERAFAVNPPTVKALVDAGYAELGADVEIEYGWRHHLDSRFAQALTLTDDGRKAYEARKAAA
jgi:hypothetical protein